MRGAADRELTRPAGSGRREGTDGAGTVDLRHPLGQRGDTRPTPKIRAEPGSVMLFYLSLRVDFTVSFDCAADFFSAQATLPANLQPAVGGSATTICRRWGKNASNVDVFDPRAQANCVANPPFDGTTRVMTMRPVANPVLPDVGGAGGSFWFTGIRSPQESQEYNSVHAAGPGQGERPDLERARPVPGVHSRHELRDDFRKPERHGGAGERRSAPGLPARCRTDQRGGRPRAVHDQ